MPETRTIPAAIQREVQLEAGYRCSIPSCRQTPTEIHHIEDWAKVQKHEAHNLIVLCRNCHGMATAGKITAMALKQLKTNAALVMNRYSDVERRVLEAFAADPTLKSVDLPGGFDLLMAYLLRDGIVVKVQSPNNVINIGGYVGTQGYALAPAGREFIVRWLEAQPLDAQG